MVILSLILLIVFLMLLIKGNIFYDYTIKTGERKLKLYEEGRTKKAVDDIVNKENLNILIFVPIIIGVFILEVIFYINALSIEQAKIVTTIMIIYEILNVISTKTKKESDLTTEEGRKQFKISLYKTSKRSIRSIITNLIKVTYFSYMFYILVFI